MAVYTESLAAQLYELILKSIMYGEYLPGEKIPTKKIAKENGVSVMPVLLALQELTNRGIVTKRARIGFYVTKFSNKELFDIARTRKMFELHCLDIYFSSLDLNLVQELYDNLLKDTGGYDDNEYQRLDTELHQLFILASDNPFLQKQYDQLRDLFIQCIYIDRKDNKTHALSRKEHLELLGHILDGNKEAALNSLRSHLERVERSIKDIDEGDG